MSACADAIFAEFAKLSLSPDERSWLERTCPYLNKGYLDYLQSYRFKPDQVTITFEPLPEDADRGQIGIVVDGLWVETIMWEVPLMACLSELYFAVVNTDWDYQGQSGESPRADKSHESNTRACRGGILQGEDLGRVGLYYQRVWNQAQKILQDSGSSGGGAHQGIQEYTLQSRSVGWNE